VTCGGRVTAEPCGRMIPARGPPSIAARSDDGNNRGISSGRLCGEVQTGRQAAR